MKTLLLVVYLFLLSNYSSSQSFFYSFENTFSGWDTTGTDLQLGDTTLVWSIHPTNELAIDSSFSMRYYLENYNDAGKIWLQKPFVVEQHTDYIVSIDYKFATSDFGLANLWTIITGVHLSPPTIAQELIYQGHTGNGFDFDTGYIWLDKNYKFTINSDTSSNLWIVIGVWGTYEGPRTYYFDSLSIQIQIDDTNNLPDDGVDIAGYYLSQNYPNPFNPTTVIEYSIPSDGFVELKIFNSSGEDIRTLVSEYKTAGAYEVTFNAQILASGIYFYRINAGKFTAVRKMVLFK